jgi:hypothetical protein
LRAPQAAKGEFPFKEIEQRSFHACHALEVLYGTRINIDAAETTKMRRCSLLRKSSTRRLE